MPGHRLVHAEHFDFVLGPDFGLVEIDVVDAGAAAVGGGSIVVGRRRIGRDRVGNRFYAVGHARQFAEQIDEFRVDAFAGREVCLVQVIGVVEVELRVGSQEDEKILEAALEFDFRMIFCISSRMRLTSSRPRR